MAAACRARLEWARALSSATPSSWVDVGRAEAALPTPAPPPQRTPPNAAAAAASAAAADAAEADAGASAANRTDAIVAALEEKLLQTVPALRRLKPSQASSSAQYKAQRATLAALLPDEATRERLLLLVAAATEEELVKGARTERPAQGG